MELGWIQQAGGVRSVIRGTVGLGRAKIAPEIGLKTDSLQYGLQSDPLMQCDSVLAPCSTGPCPVLMPVFVSLVVSGTFSAGGGGGGVGW